MNDGAPLDRAAWADLVAAHAALETLQGDTAFLLSQLLETLTAAAADHHIYQPRAAALRTAAVELLHQQADVLGDLERAIAALEPADDA